MSLRARVLLGLAVIAARLRGDRGGRAPASPRPTCVEQVDDQLRATDFPYRGDLAVGAERGPPSPTPDDETPPERPSRMYIGIVDADADVSEIFAPNVGRRPRPRPSTVEQAIAEAGNGPYTQPAGDSGSRFRLISREVDDGDTDGDVVVVGLPLDDVDATVSRLVQIEVGALAARALRARLWWPGG